MPYPVFLGSSCNFRASIICSTARARVRSSTLEFRVARHMGQLEILVEQELHVRCPFGHWRIFEYVIPWQTVHWTISSNFCFRASIFAIVRWFDCKIKNIIVLSLQYYVIYLSVLGLLCPIYRSIRSRSAQNIFHLNSSREPVYRSDMMMTNFSWVMATNILNVRSIFISNNSQYNTWEPELHFGRWW